MEELVTKKFGVSHVYAMDYVGTHESNFRPDAVNSSSGACGIPQALPCSKLPCPLTFAGAECQLNWMVNYIANRYTNPIGAMKFWEENRWY